MRKQLGERLPNFTPAESALLLGSSDFYGMNTYTSVYIKDKSTPPDIQDYLGNVESSQIGPDGQPMGPPAESSWLKDGIPALSLDELTHSTLGIPKATKLGVEEISSAYLCDRKWFLSTKRELSLLRRSNT